MSSFYFAKGTAFRNLFIFVFSVLGFVTAGAQPVLSFQPGVGGLSAPVDIVNAGDHSNRIFIVQQAGTIKVYDQTLTYLSDFLTVPTGYDGGERGLLSLAFHPDYASNGFFFVYYNNPAGDVEVARYHTPSGTPNVADPASKVVLLTIPHPTNSNHNGGKLNFGNDGYLYFATGDGGGGGDVPNNAQNGATLLGKMVRIAVTTTPTAPFYTIPPDNPFLTVGDNIMDEIWAFGLRNPFRWSFDRTTHDMWIGDVGQDAWEEVDFRPNGSTGGINYGWHCIEGTHNYPPVTPGCVLTAGTYAPPLLDYPHVNATGGRAVIGGFVYRGSQYPAMAGYYIFGDEVSANVWLLPPNGTAADTIQFTGALPGVSAFGEAENGELYAVSVSGGQLFSVTDVSAALPVKLVSLTGTAYSGYNQLNWEAGNEQQFRQYEVEYSADAIHFQQAGIITGTGATHYTFKHTVAASQKLYYRLKMVDIDGAAVYSKTIVVNAATSAREGNFVTPSVVTNRLFTVHLASPYNSVQVISMEGRMVYQASISNSTGKINIQLPAVPAGQYLVRLVNGSKQFTQKIILQ